MYKSLFFTFITIFFQACSNDVVYQKKFELENNSWKSEQILSYIWEIKDTTQWYSMVLEITHDVDFRFQNQYVKTKTTFPDSTFQEQVLSLELFDDTGRPFGNCGSSDCQTPIQLQTKVKFAKGGSYQLQVKQDGRESESKGIHSIELKIAKARN